jgi:hypothetical protein
VITLLVEESVCLSHPATQQIEQRGPFSRPLYGRAIRLSTDSCPNIGRIETFDKPRGPSWRESQTARERVRYGASTLTLILHTVRGERHYSALFSNTAHEHKLGKTQDWVILYYDRRTGEHQSTVITSQFGALKGKRIVRGREGRARNATAWYNVTFTAHNRGEL